MKILAEQVLLRCDCLLYERLCEICHLFLYAVNSLLLLVTHNISIGRCGYPCFHVLKVTDEITFDMIKVQHGKIFATHYEDMSLEIGMELKKMQFRYQQNECLGVPITWDILHRSHRPSIDYVLPYFYDIRTTEAEYQRAKMVEFMKCCVTKIQYALSNKDQIEEGMVSAFFCYVERFHLFNEVGSSMNSFKFCQIK